MRAFFVRKFVQSPNVTRKKAFVRKIRSFNVNGIDLRWAAAEVRWTDTTTVTAAATAVIQATTGTYTSSEAPRTGGGQLGKHDNCQLRISTNIFILKT